MKSARRVFARWRLRCALEARRIRLLIEIPLEVHDGQSSYPAADASAATGSGAGTADRGGHDTNHARERSASAQVQQSVAREGDPQGSPSRRPDDPSAYLLEHEPIPDGAPVDYRYMFELMRDRVEREEDRGKSLDGKIANVIAGIVASIGFSLRVNGSAASYLAAMLYLVPLTTLFLTFRTKYLREAPTAESILRFLPTYPVSALKEGCQAMMNAITENRRINDTKAKLFDRSILFTIIATTIVLVVQVALATSKGDLLGVRPKPVTVSSSATRAAAARAPAPRPTNGCRHDRLHPKGCHNGQPPKVTARP